MSVDSGTSCAAFRKGQRWCFWWMGVWVVWRVRACSGGRKG